VYIGIYTIYIPFDLLSSHRKVIMVLMPIADDMNSNEGPANRSFVFRIEPTELGGPTKLASK